MAKASRENFMVKKKRKFQNFLWMFFYIYNVLFAGVPAMFRTRMIIGGWGTIVLLFKKGHYWSYIFTTIILLNMLFVACTVVTAAVNSHYDLWFTQYATLCCIYLMGGIYVSSQFRVKVYSFDDFLYFIAWVILIHSILTICGYAIRPLGQWIYTIQSFGGADNVISTVTYWHSRAIGFGIGSFFSGGILCGLGAILFTYLVKISYLKPAKGGILTILSIILGMFIARTSMFGLLGLLMFVNVNGSDWNKALKIIISAVVTLGFLYLVYLQFFAKSLSLDWAFELFINFFQNDDISTKSTTALKSMWIFPDNLKTWIVGDGLFFDKRGNYYMHTDVGYLRIIFDIGLLGMIVFFANQAYLVYAMWKLSGRNASVLKLGIVLSIYILILNIKGFAELNFFYYMVIPFLHNRRVYLRELNVRRR